MFLRLYFQRSRLPISVLRVSLHEKQQLREVLGGQSRARSWVPLSERGTRGAKGGEENESWKPGSRKIEGVERRTNAALPDPEEVIRVRPRCDDGGGR